MAKKEKIVIPNCRIDGYRKKYEAADNAAIVLALVGDATEENLKVLDISPGHGLKKWTAPEEVADDDVGVRLLHPAFEGSAGKLAIAISAARLHSIGGDVENTTLRVKLTVLGTGHAYTDWESVFGKPWVGTVEIQARGQRSLFENASEG